MKPQDLQTGHEYLIRAKFDHKDYDNDYNFIAEPSEHRIFLDEKSVRQSVIQTLEPPPSVGSTPKYDPCRLLKKGDRVQVKRRNGRCNGKDGEYLREAFCVVAEDEIPNELVRVYHNSTEYRLDPAYLELATPVEELERYVIIHNEREKYYDVCWKDDDEPDGRTGRTRVRATFWYHKPPQTYSQTEALSAAETERDRLNAEHRKEQA